MALLFTPPAAARLLLLPWLDLFLFKLLLLLPVPGAWEDICWDSGWCAGKLPVVLVIFFTFGGSSEVGELKSNDSRDLGERTELGIF